MVALARAVLKWRDSAVQEPPKDGTPFVAEDGDGEMVIVEWRDERWVMGRTVDGGWIELVGTIVRWRHFV